MPFVTDCGVRYSTESGVTFNPGPANRLTTPYPYVDFHIPIDFLSSLPPGSALLPGASFGVRGTVSVSGNGMYPYAYMHDEQWEGSTWHALYMIPENPQPPPYYWLGGFAPEPFLYTTGNAEGKAFDLCDTWPPDTTGLPPGGRLRCILGDCRFYLGDTDSDFTTETTCPFPGSFGQSINDPITGTTLPPMVPPVAVVRWFGPFHDAPDSISFSDLRAYLRYEYQYWQDEGGGGDPPGGGIDAVGPLEYDRERDWLHVAPADDCRTYAVRDKEFLFNGGGLTGGNWITLRRNPRSGLWMLADSDTTDDFYLYRSTDGGQTTEEKLNVTAERVRLEVDPVRNWIILLLEAADGTITRRYSDDNGDTFTAAENVDFDGSQLDCELVDTAFHVTHGLMLACKIGADHKLLRSNDGGHTFEEWLS